MPPQQQSQTQLAMQVAPGYWLAWYSAKSIALCLTFGALCYYVGKEHGRRG